MYCRSPSFEKIVNLNHICLMYVATIASTSVLQVVSVVSLFFLEKKACADFLAGSTLRSKSRYAALSETAIFARACRHEFP